MADFLVGDRASFAHPAGRVYGQVTKVEARLVVLEIQRYGGMPPLDLSFTKRADNSYREVGKGPRSPHLERES